MATEDDPNPFTYHVPLPAVSRNIALAAIVLYSCAFFYIPYRWGLQRTIESIQSDSWFWIVMITQFAPVIAFFLLLAFPPKSWLARVEADSGRLCYFPKPPLRWIGEPPVEVALDPHCNEIILYRGTVDRSRYGLRIVVRAANRNQRESKIDSAILTAHQARSLADGIAAATGLHVGLIEREKSDEGKIVDLPWTPDSAASRLLRLGKLALVASPLLGGLIVGLLRASGTTAAFVGIFLWLVQTAGGLVLTPLLHHRSKLAFAYWLTTAFTFAASYTVVYLITINGLRVQ